MSVLRATLHTTLQAIPTQLVFDRNAIINLPLKPNWLRMKENKNKKERKTEIEIIKRKKKRKRKNESHMSKIKNFK